MTRPPLVPLLLLRALLPRAERDEVVHDIRAEFTHRADTHGGEHARRWIWGQALRSVPPLVRWTGRREWTGFEPRANAYRPGGPMLRHLVTDARYAARRLRARGSYTLVAVLTLALGIAGTTAAWAIARPLVLDPLPFANEREVVQFWMDGAWTEEEFVYLRGKIPGYRAVAAHRQTNYTLRDGDAPARLLPGLATTTELFDVLGARPALGRGFRPGEDAIGAEGVAVISHGLWQELGGGQEVIGSRITLDGAPRTVVGVMPRGFWFPDPSVRLWLPHPMNPEGRNGSWVLVGRVAEGQDPGRMEAHVARLTRMLAERFEYTPDWDKTRNAWVKPIRELLLGGMRPALLATLVSMGLILLIACTNVSALMLGQLESRATELAVRAALGANRRRLTQPLVVEAVLIGALAALAGGVLAVVGFRVLAEALPIGAWAESATFDWRLFGIALAVALAAVLLVVLVPASSLWRQDARGDLQGALSRTRTGGVQGGGQRLERGLVVVEVALAMLIAAGATLLVRSVANLYAIDPGIDTEGIAIVDATSGTNIPPAERRRIVNRTVEALRGIPGVQAVSAAMKMPLRGRGDSFGIRVEGREERDGSATYFRIVTREHFATLGIAVRSGRTFDASDRENETEVAVVVNEALAKRYFPGEDPIGRRVLGGFGVPQRIVGVVQDVAEARLTEEREPVRYYLADQVPWFGTRVHFLVRAARPADAEAMVDAARRIVQQSAPELAIQGTSTISRIFDVAVGPARQVMTLLTLLSTLALVLGAVGIYGVISHFASRRQRDWAIRVALGLPGSGVVRHIVGQGTALVLAGVVLGAIGAYALSQLLASFLFGVSRLDPVAFAIAGVALLATGAVAAYIPARRAGRVDPALVLREQA